MEFLLILLGSGLPRLTMLNKELLKAESCEKGEDVCACCCSNDRLAQHHMRVCTLQTRMWCCCINAVECIENARKELIASRRSAVLVEKMTHRSYKC